MEATELKIGNYVNCIKGLVKIIAIRKNQVEVEYGSVATLTTVISTKCIENVPLNVEWLPRCGFTSDSTGTYYTNKRLCLEVITADCIIFRSGRLDHTHRIYSLHQLQNLHSTLNNEELQIA